MVDGFLGRWSKRKLDAKDGKPLAPEPAVAVDPAMTATVAVPVIPAQAAILELRADADPGLRRDASGLQDDSPLPEANPAPLTLEDARALTAESDFRPFVARGVAPEVKNAAMKTLFSDPHFNVMDRLDTYIDDYSQPDPIPRDMLRKLASAKFLGLFDQEERQEAEEAARRAREVADNPASETVAQSAAAPVVPSALSDEDPDLRLQPNDASPGKAPGGSAA